MRVRRGGENQEATAGVPSRTAACGRLTITYPLDGTMFPPEIIAPTFRWADTSGGVSGWSVEVHLPGSPSEAGGPAGVIRAVVQTPRWRPTGQQWEAIKRATVGKAARVVVRGLAGSENGRVVSEDEVRILTSSDEVGAPIFYREVNLPFSAAVRDPARLIRWRFGTISGEDKPPTVLEKLPVCGNCHSFSADGRTLGMDVDYGNDKGSYAVCSVSQEILLSRENIITWSDFRREDKKKTFGLLSQVSPDGRYVISTVKDLSVFLAIDGDLAFSQLFFPIQGILCYYDRQTRTFHALPGADDPKYVQTNPVWSPDGKYIVFARSEAYQAPKARVGRRGISAPEDVPDFVSRKRKFRYDLYRIPFNGGRGGRPEPVRGASHNGRSNYFPKYSPDGKWIVFCQADSFMLLQPDSQLYIIPAEGGEARRLECNTPRMNSWHSWSPNGRWLVFSSKAYSPYTQLMLTHVDEQGHTTPPVILEHFTSPDRAANIPEFVNTTPYAIRRIRYDEEFFAEAIHLNAGDRYAAQGDFKRAVEEFQQAIQANPDNPYGYRAWARVRLLEGKLEEAESLLRKAYRVAPDDPYVNWQLGQVLQARGKVAEAEQMYRQAIRSDSVFAPAYLDLARLLLEKGETQLGRHVLREVIRIKPHKVEAYCLLGDSLAANGQEAEAVATYRQALEKQPEYVPAMVALARLLARWPSDDDQARREAVQLANRACQLTNYGQPDALLALSDAYAATGQQARAVSLAYKALRIADESGRTDWARSARQRLDKYDEP